MAVEGVVAAGDRARGNVVLTGFMGTGKSSVGRLVAIELGYEWVDTDSVVEARHGPILDIFSNSGEEAFRDMERSLAAELAGRDGLVVSTGGRMMLDEETAALLGAGARVFCLTATVGEIMRRVVDQDGPVRPLLAGTRPVERIEQLLAERESAYLRFEQVATDGRSAAEVAADIVARVLGSQTSSEATS
jgi:shikimate kinase